MAMTGGILSAEEKRIEIDGWLHSLLDETDMVYEKNEVTLDILYAMMQRCRVSEAASVARIEDLKQKTEEYASEGQRLSAIISQLGLGEESLSQSGKASLQEIADTALALETSDADTKSLCLAMSDMTDRGFDLEEGILNMQHENSRLGRNISSVLAKKQKLEKELKTLDDEARDDSSVAMKSKEEKFYNHKSREYNNKIKQFELALSSSGVEPSLYHSALLKKAEELRQLHNKLQPIQAKLDSYQNLPANPAMAKVKLEEAKQELRVLEEKVSQNLDLHNL